MRLMEEPPGPPVKTTVVSKAVSEDSVVREQISTALSALYKILLEWLIGILVLMSLAGRISYVFDSVPLIILGLVVSQ